MVEKKSREQPFYPVGVRQNQPQILRIDGFGSRKIIVSSIEIETILLMANTYTSIRIHFVFAVKFRRNLIHKSWKDELFKYMTGIIHNHQHQVLAINGVEDHVHILIGLHPNQSISELMKEVKASSSKWINEQRKTATKFSWQEGFGAFSHSSDTIPTVIRYIQNQEEHHAKKTFHDEFQLMLNRFEVSYDERYVFKEPV